MITIKSFLLEPIPLLGCIENGFMSENCISKGPGPPMDAGKPPQKELGLWKATSNGPGTLGKIWAPLEWLLQLHKSSRCAPGHLRSFKVASSGTQGDQVV